MLALNNLRTSLSAVWSSISVTATFLTGLVIFAFAWAFNFTSLLASLVLNHRLFNHRCCRLEMWHKRSGLNYSKDWVAELLTWHSRTLAFFTSGSFSFTSNSPTFWGKKGPVSHLDPCNNSEAVSPRDAWSAGLITVLMYSQELGIVALQIFCARFETYTWNLYAKLETLTLAAPNHT